MSENNDANVVPEENVTADNSNAAQPTGGDAANVAPEARNAQGDKDTDAIDSVGNPKANEEVPGPRGPQAEETVHDSGPAQVVKAAIANEAAKPEVDHTTDFLDSANNKIDEEHAYIPGPRGPSAAKLSPDSYRR